MRITGTITKVTEPSSRVLKLKTWEVLARTTTSSSRPRESLWVLRLWRTGQFTLDSG